MQASMKSNVYQIYMLIGHEGDLAIVLSATCKCVAGCVFSFTDLLIYLRFTTPAQLQFLVYAVRMKYHV